MSTRTLPTLPLAVLALLAALTFWLNQFVQVPSARADGSKRHDPDLIVENFTAQALGETGEVQYTVKAARLAHFPDDDSSTMETVVFTALHPSLPPVVAIAPRGRLLAGVDEVIMEGGVLVTSEKSEKLPPLKLAAPSINIFPDKNLVRASEGVRVDGLTSQITAKKMELNSLTRRVVLERGRITYQQPPRKTP
ncbi:MAG: LPS export ABC transporter periplasmic protein LptC [Burkholderiales bacterium]|nr:LPS export ABC transporter periplasmic protein LptC [Burkholderiales bacterium]